MLPFGHKSSENPIPKKKRRKLYSSNQIEPEPPFVQSDNSDENIPPSCVKSIVDLDSIKTLYLQPESKATRTSYGELEKILPLRKVAPYNDLSPQVPPNTSFNDELKEEIDYKDKKMVGEKVSDTATLINSSDSDEREKIEASTSTKSARANKGRGEKRTKRAKSKSNSFKEEGIGHVSEKGKSLIKGHYSKGTKQNSKVILTKHLEEEKIRDATHNDLNLSFIAKKKQIDTEMEPDVIHSSPFKLVPEIKEGIDNKDKKLFNEIVSDTVNFIYISDSDERKQTEASTSTKSAGANKGKRGKRTNQAESKTNIFKEEGISHVSEKGKSLIKGHYSKGTKQNSKVILRKHLEEEKIRGATHNELNLSFIAEENEIDTELEPDVIHSSQVKIVPEINIQDDTETQTITKKSIVKKQYEKQSSKKEKVRDIEEKQDAKDIEEKQNAKKSLQLPIEIDIALKEGHEIDITPQSNSREPVESGLVQIISRSLSQQSHKINEIESTSGSSYTQESSSKEQNIDHSACEDTNERFLELVDETIIESSGCSTRSYQQFLSFMKNRRKEIDEERRKCCAETSKKIAQIFMEINERDAEIEDGFSCETTRRITEIILNEQRSMKAAARMLREEARAAMEHFQGGRK